MARTYMFTCEKCGDRYNGLHDRGLTVGHTPEQCIAALRKRLEQLEALIMSDGK